MFTIFVYSDEFFDGGLRKTLFTAREKVGDTLIAEAKSTHSAEEAVAMLSAKAAKAGGFVGGAQF